MKKKDTTLEYYGGNGYDGVSEIGDFEVKVGLIDRPFKSLKAARAFYDSIKHIEKALWDVTTIPELLECHTVK